MFVEWAKYWFAYWGTQHWTANCGEWYWTACCGEWYWTACCDEWHWIAHCGSEKNVPADSTNNLLNVLNKTSNVTTNNEEVICEIDYKQEQQGLVIIGEEIPSHYYKMCIAIAIANTFKYKYAFMILEIYIITLYYTFSASIRGSKKPFFCFLVINCHYHACSNNSW